MPCRDGFLGGGACLVVGFMGLNSMLSSTDKCSVLYNINVRYLGVKIKCIK